MQSPQNQSVIIGIVGPCSSGKSTLITGLKWRGIQARHIAQEHSHVQDMWRQITNPRVLIYLDVSYEVSMKRRKLDMTREEFQNEIELLRHARQGADLYIETDDLSITQVLDRVLAFLAERGIPGK
jgi:molybdopterin-guanine dinucleotide biosynthesis protein